MWLLQTTAYGGVMVHAWSLIPNKPHLSAMRAVSEHDCWQYDDAISR